MKLAFLTGALSAGVAAAVLATLLIWIVTVLAGSPDPWSIAPFLVALAAVAFGGATFVAERIAHRRTLARKRAKGEPWAFRDEG
ncbi:MAG TPA: hypothetical protein VM253_05295 [Candidatus Limnocylindrales bacterium]|nr:hypothetical protein [Candidatus Limnocylindrales bacterium]